MLLTFLAWQRKSLYLKHNISRFHTPSDTQKQPRFWLSKNSKHLPHALHRRSVLLSDFPQIIYGDALLLFCYALGGTRGENTSWQLVYSRQILGSLYNRGQKVQTHNRAMEKWLSSRLCVSCPRKGRALSLKGAWQKWSPYF